MGQRHKHADAIHAWAEGAEIEYRSHIDGGWVKAETPGWLENYEYRVKPPAKKYRVALFNNGKPYTSTADNPEDEAFFQRATGFVRWLTDWVKYEE